MDGRHKLAAEIHMPKKSNWVMMLRKRSLEPMCVRPCDRHANPSSDMHVFYLIDLDKLLSFPESGAREIPARATAYLHLEP